MYPCTSKSYKCKGTSRGMAVSRIRAALGPYSVATTACATAPQPQGQPTSTACKYCQSGRFGLLTKWAARTWVGDSLPLVLSAANAALEQSGAAISHTFASEVSKNSQTMRSMPLQHQKPTNTATVRLQRASCWQQCMVFVRVMCRRSQHAEACGFRLL